MSFDKSFGGEGFNLNTKGDDELKYISSESLKNASQTPIIQGDGKGFIIPFSKPTNAKKMSIHVRTATTTAENNYKNYMFNTVLGFSNPLKTIVIDTTSLRNTTDYFESAIIDIPNSLFFVMNGLVGGQGTVAQVFFIDIDYYE